MNGDQFNVMISIPCLNRGGTEFQTLQLVRVLIQLQQHVTVVCYYEFEQEMVALFEREGAKIELLHYSRKMGAFKFILAFSSYLKKAKPAVVHAQYMAPGALPILSAVLARVPRIIATVHQPYTASHEWKSKWILRFAAYFCKPFLSVSQNAARSWFGKTDLIDTAHPINKQAKQLTLYNTIDVQKIKDLEAIPYDKIPQRLNTSHPIIGTVSRLRHEKGIDVLIQAFSSVNKIYPSAQLLLVGDGPQRCEYETLVKQLKLEQQVVFFGAADWETAMQLMSLMDVVVVPSRFEGFGLTAAEAMAMGKPVVASDTFGLKELIDHEQTGLVFENENSEELSEQILRFLKDENLSEQCGRNASQKALTQFDYPIFVQNISCLYHLDS
jgi:glycosyltransferase involved in cell wall biosynthesis